MQLSALIISNYNFLIFKSKFKRKYDGYIIIWSDLERINKVAAESQ